MPQQLRAETILNSLEEHTKTGHLCDVLFYNNRGSLWAHSCILAGFSPFFSRFFLVHLENSNHWSLKQPMQINLSNITKCKSDSNINCIQCLAQIVKFIYTGYIKPNVMHLQHLLILSNRLENEELIELCKKFQRERSLLKIGVDKRERKSIVQVRSEDLNRTFQNNEQALESSKLIIVETPLLEIECPEVNSASADSSKDLSGDGCRICSFISEDRDLIEMHSKVFHSSFYKCVYCGFSHKNITIFTGHIVEQCRSERENVICSICLFKADSLAHLLSHVKDHLCSKPFSCRTCERAFERRSLWLKHSRSHILNKSFHCSSCELKFNTDAERSKHFKAIHAPKKYICDECGFCAPFPYVLDKHKLKHRKSVLTCDEDGCDFRTSSEIMLLRHRSAHAPRKVKKVKSKECPVCKIQFTLSKNLIRHMKVHKLKSGKLKCELCTYETFRSDKYNEHVSNKHPNDERVAVASNSSSSNSLADTKSQVIGDRIQSTTSGEATCNKEGLARGDASYVETRFSQKHNRLMMNDEGDISIVDTNEKNSVTLRNIGNLTGTITLNERTGVLTMSNINSGSVFLNETTGELTYINLENDKNIELNYFSSETMKHVDNFEASIASQNMKAEVTKLDECTGEIIKVLPSNEDTFTPEQEFDYFDMDVNDESLDGFDDFDELLFDVFNENGDEFDRQVVLKSDQSTSECSGVMPHLDESTGLLTFDKSLAQREIWNASFARHTENSSKMDDDKAYQLLLDEVTGVLHD